MFLGQRTEPPRGVRFSGGGLKISCDLEKWKTSDFLYSTTKPNLKRRKEATL